MSWKIPASLAPLLAAVPAFADEPIRQVNNQESLYIGFAPLQASEQAVSAQGTPFLNHESGKRYLVGYDTARTRTLFGVPNLYTDFEFLFGVGTLGYQGSSIDPSTTASTAIDQSLTYTEESI